MNATPYLYSVPPDLACFAPLLKSLGVRESFGASDFVQVLQTMAIETGAKADPAASSITTVLSTLSSGIWGPGKRTTTLTHFQLELAIALVQRLSDEVMQVADWEIYAPDEAGHLALATDLVYDGKKLSGNQRPFFLF